MTHKYVQKIISKKQAHKKRNIVIRAIYVVSGFLIALCGLPLLIIFPEAGIPLTLISLAILSLEFTWAGNALEWISIKFDKLLAWLRKQPAIFHILMFGLFIIIGLLIFYIIQK